MREDSFEPGTDRQPGQDPPLSDPRALSHLPHRSVRLITLYATSWRGEAPKRRHLPLADQLPLGRLAPFYQRYAAELPRVLVDEPLDPTRAGFRRWRHGTPAGGRLRLLSMPSHQVIAGLAMDVAGELPEVGDLVEDCARGEVTFGGQDVAELAAAAVAERAGEADQAGITGVWHQIVVAPTPPRSRAVMEGILARASAGYGGEPGVPSYPAQLNRLGAAAAITPYATVLCGQPEHVANAALIVAAQALANAVRLQDILDTLYHELRLFWEVDRSFQGTRRRRAALETITHRLARLELDLTVAVEAPTSIGMRVPSPLVREYQQQMYAALDIPVLADDASRMLRRLEATGRAELSSVTNIERRADEDRHQRWAVAVGFVSTVAIPLSLILAFFSADVAEIDSSRSMFHREYIWVYGAVALIVLVAIVVGVGTYLIQRHGPDQE